MLDVSVVILICQWYNAGLSLQVGGHVASATKHRSWCEWYELGLVWSCSFPKLVMYLQCSMVLPVHASVLTLNVAVMHVSYTDVMQKKKQCVL